MVIFHGKMLVHQRVNGPKLGDFTEFTFKNWDESAHKGFFLMGCSENCNVNFCVFNRF